MLMIVKSYRQHHYHHHHTPDNRRKLYFSDNYLFEFLAI